MRGIMEQRRYIALFVLPALLLFVCFAASPLICTGIYSFFSYDGIGDMRFIGLDNYRQLFTGDRYFPTSVLNSLVLAGASVFIQLPIAFILALTLARGVRGESFFRTVYFLPVVISSMVIGQLWMRIFKSDYGLLNSFLRIIGFEGFEFSWLSDPRTAFICTVIPAVWQYTGYHMLILYAGIKSLPTDYFEAAAIEGATGRQQVFGITIPLLSQVIKTCLIFALTGAFRAFDLIYVMTNGGPNHASEVPATLMYTNLFRKNLYGYGSAQAFFIVVECFLFSFIVARLFKRTDESAAAI